MTLIGLWLAILGYGVLYAGKMKLEGKDCSLAKAFQGQCGSGPTTPPDAVSAIAQGITASQGNPGQAKNELGQAGNAIVQGAPNQSIQGVFGSHPFGGRAQQRRWLEWAGAY